MEFDGVVGEVGRAGAYEFIVSYMPLRSSLILCRLTVWGHTSI